MRSRIAITGGRGRLARVAAAYFRQQGYEVTLFSREAGNGMKTLNDLFDPHVLSSFSALIHAAWSTVPFTSEEDPGREEREDLPLLKKILESLHHLPSEAPMPKLIFISSASVYGNQEKEPAREVTLCTPLSRYARAKLSAERLILEAAVHEPRLKSVILRVTNLVGIPSHAALPQGVLSQIVAAAKNHRPLELWGDGKGSKDYLWIDDCLEALQAAMESSAEGVFNIGSGNNFSLLELIKIAEEITQQPLQIKYCPCYSWDVNYSKVSSALFSEVTGWRPKCDIVQKMTALFS